MKIMIICHNYGAMTDAIGMLTEKIYTRIFMQNELIVCTSSIDEKKDNKFFAMGMTLAFFKAIKKLMSNKIDVIDIEYPFQEWNPLFLIPFFIICIMSRVRGGKIQVTVHEYVRANILRKIIVAILCCFSDYVLVGEKKNYSAVKCLNKHTYMYEIPSQVDYKIDYNIAKEKKFCYIGLVNKSKAFGEMINAWNCFNKEEKYELFVLSATKIEGMEKCRNIHYVYSGPDALVSNVLSECAFTIMPIKPMVSENNTSFKTATAAGCISIGVFCNKYKKMPFTVDMVDYKQDNFVNAFRKCISLNVNQMESACKAAREYGKRFNINNTCEHIREIINSNI